MTDRKRYFEEATSWATETRARESRALRLAWTIAGVAAGVAMLEAVALALLTPLKTVQPITVLVDRQTGFVQTLDPATPRRIHADAALTTSMLAQYVAAREGFDRATVARDYDHVALWSAGTARSQYLASMPASNPESPLQRYAGGTVVAARVKSVSPLSGGVSLVRFDTQLQDRSGHAAPAQPWIAVVRYRYSDAAMSFESRLANPLGFQVTGYRRDAEAPPPTPSAVAATAPDRVFARAEPPASRSPASPVDAYRLADRGLSPNNIPMGSPLAPARRFAGTASP